MAMTDRTHEDRMRLPIWIALALLAGPALAADTLVERNLARAIVTHCKSTVTAPTVIYLLDGEEAPAVTGDMIPADTDCVVSDSRINSQYLDGRLLVWSDDEGVITEVLYDADIIGSGGRRYRVSQWGETLYQQANGSRYALQSRLGEQDEFVMTMFRRTPDDCMGASGEVETCPDRTTSIIVDVAPGTWALLDYRPE